MKQIIYTLFIIPFLFGCGGSNHIPLEDLSEFDESEKMPEDISEGEMGYNCELNLVEILADIRKNFTFIARKDYDLSDKIERAHITMNYFDDSKSNIQVTSKNHDRILIYTIEEYLTRLANMTLNEYEDIDLYFDKKYKISDLKEGTGGIKQFVVSMDQIFIGYDREGRVRYADKTKKIFRFELIIKNNTTCEFKILDVLAKEPRNLNQNEIDSIIFKEDPLQLKPEKDNENE
jgi:transcriptional regulator